MPKLSDPDQAQPSGPQGTLSLLRPIGGRAAGEPPPAAPSKMAPGTGDPIALCLRGMTWGEAPCVGFVGDRGSGKSIAMRAVLAGWLARNPGVALICDRGGSSGFPGQRRISLSDLRLEPMAPEPRSVVFTGDLSSGQAPDVEEVARFAWQLRQSRTGSLVVCDELKWTARAGHWRPGVHFVPQACTEGRKHDVGILWASQCPQDAPREAIEESALLVCFKLAGLSVNCLDDRNYLVGLPPGTLESLPGEETPKPDRGRCVILRRGQPWDRRFYRFPL
jgi:hypothetical protein